MAKGILTALILCFIILEAVHVAEAGTFSETYEQCLDNCKKRCEKKTLKTVCKASCQVFTCKASGGGGNYINFFLKKIAISFIG
jgi:hypothetical protein